MKWPILVSKGSKTNRLSSKTSYMHLKTQIKGRLFIKEEHLQNLCFRPYPGENCILQGVRSIIICIERVKCQWRCIKNMLNLAPTATISEEMMNKPDLEPWLWRYGFWGSNPDLTTLLTPRVIARIDHDDTSYPVKRLAWLSCIKWLWDEQTYILHDFLLPTHSAIATVVACWNWD